MRYRYHDLVGKHVITVDGHDVGRVADLLAERRGEALRVTALLVGDMELIRRIGFRHLTRGRGIPPHEVPWRFVARIGDHVYLRLPLARLHEEEPHGRGTAR